MPVTTNSTDWNISTDIYGIVDSVNNIKNDTLTTKMKPHSHLVFLVS